MSRGGRETQGREQATLVPRLTETITPKDGKPLRTLADVVAYMDASIPRERLENERSRWHQVGKALLEAATENGNTDAVTEALRTALFYENKLKMD